MQKRYPNRSKAAARVASLSLLAATTVGLTPASAHAEIAQAWGYGGEGQIGNGSSVNSSAPVAVTGLTTGVTAVAGGTGHSLAIQDGALKAWGSGASGALGGGSTADSNIPIQVVGLTTGVTAVAGGSSHSLAIQNGAAKAWGYSGFGQLGNGAKLNSSVPVQVTELTTGVTAIAAGAFHSLAIQNGAAKAWGDNRFYGQLGNGTFSESTIPVQVTGLTTGVTAIAAGAFHSLAIRDGAAVAWGSGGSGELGSGAFDRSDIPVQVTGLTAGVTAVAGGNEHSLAIQNGNVLAWGAPSFGALGTGASAAYSNVPLPVLDLPVDLLDVAAGGYSSYALSADGSLWVWGDNSYGQLGLGNTTNQQLPQQLFAPAGYRFTSIDAGPGSTHAVATIAPVPEPTTLGLIALGGVALLRRRRV